MRALIFVALLFLVPFALSEERPNIVYIISDDQTWSDFGFMGNDRVYTPNLDRLASQSATFPNGYLTTSVCRPSLVTLMTGLYPHQHQIHFNHGPPGNSAYNRMTSVEEYLTTREREFDLIGKVETLPRLLVENLGYRALQTGKYWEGHWRNGGFTEGMSTFTAPPATQTYGGIRKLASGDLVAHGNGDSGLQIGRETMKPIQEFILDCEREKEPWLVWYAPYLPHQPHDSPEQFYDIAESTPGVKPHEIPYFAAIAQFDETVGDLIDFVESNSDAGNTIFVFVSDNGWAPSESPEKKRPQEFAHTKTSKRAPFDEGVRSPILIRWDGVIPAARYENLVSSIDIVPTLLKLAGAAAEDFERMPGCDLLGDLDPERAVFGAIYPGDAGALGQPDRDVAYRWVRQGDFKLIVPVGPNAWGSYLKKPALYNVMKDPEEKVNLIDNSEMDEVVSDLETRLDHWWKP
ncbi:MAG: sulfatase-like hydrolase/transferase [Verrucomicrobiales bacterium]|nr:sulfatase-like hydrolase/transferase [Verrucomicrobiales bacterium]